MRQRIARLGRVGSSVVLTLGIIVAVLAANIVAGRAGSAVDLSPGASLTLSSETKQILGMVDGPLSIEVFVRPDSPSGRDAAALASRYEDENADISLDVVDPDAEPGRVERLGVEQFGTSVLRYDGRRIDVVTPSEVELTSAILRLVRGRVPSVCFLTGHGESSPDDTGPRGLADFGALATDNGFAIESRNLSTDGTDGCDTMVMAGARVPLADQEQTELQRFLDENGKLMILADALSEIDINPIIEPFGITFLGGVVLDRASNYGNDISTPIVVDLPSSSPVVDGVPSLLLPAAAGLLVEDQMPRESLFVSQLARSSDDSVLAADPEDPSQGGLTGPILVAAAADDSAVSGSSPRIDRTRLLVVSDVAFAENASLRALGNATLLANGLSWLAQDELLLTIGTRQPGYAPVVIDPARRRTAVAVSAIGVPAAVLAIGLVVMFRRRRA